MPDLQQENSDINVDPRERFPKGDIDEKKSEQIYDSLLSMVTEKTEISPTGIEPETDVLSDLGLDSLQMYEIVVDMEEIYQIRISDEDLERVRTVQNLVDLVYNLSV